MSECLEAAGQIVRATFCPFAPQAEIAFAAANACSFGRGKRGRWMALATMPWGIPPNSSALTNSEDKYRRSPQVDLSQLK